MRFLANVLGVTALYVSSAYASIATFAPSSAKGVSYSVSIPPSTSSSGSGDVFLQISGPSTYQWLGVGIGTGMSGATIFVMYTDGTGNVTISPRKSSGEVMPTFNSAASVTLLAGSGVANGVMTANVRYTAASGLLTTSSTKSPWICSWKSGKALDTTSQSAMINQHDDHDTFTFDLTKAVAAADSNPFVTAAAASSTAAVPSTTAAGGVTSTAASGASSSSGATTTPVVVSPASGGTSNSGSSSSSSGPSSSDIKTFQQAHGIIMASTFVVILPLGAIIMRVFGGVWLHAAIQIFSLIAILAGFGLGVRLGQNTSNLYNTTHTIFGTVIVGLFLIQPLVGLLHHKQYQRVGHRSYFGHAHIWYGRLLIVLAVINGGLGLQLAANTTNGEIAYGVVAGVMFVIYMGAVLLTAMKKTRGEKSEIRRLNS